ncbi:MAG: methionyl-tRNA formyltransferase [Bacteroidales bacterium]|nr:methionyl-tRNA formyltransferase [Bacteroidales bacterium]
MDKSLNIVFFGIDGFSNVVLNSLVESEHKVLLVITHPYDDKAFKSLSSTCDKNNIPIIKANKINSDEVVSRVRECSSDLCVIAHFERIIRSELLGIPKLGFINLHPSLLPYYRGLAPQHYPIINGEKEVGITVHYVDEGTDTGDIILQKRYPLSEDAYVADLHMLWMREYKTIVIEAIDLIISHASVIKQSKGEGSFYPKMESKPYPLDKSWTVKEAYNWVRAMSMPYDGVQYDDMVVYKAHILEEGEKPDDDEPILNFCDGALVAEWYE